VGIEWIPKQTEGEMNLSALHELVRDLARSGTGVVPHDGHQRLSGPERHVLAGLRRRLADAGSIERLVPASGTATWTTPSEPVVE
jgi:hypothetical protein